MAGHIPWRVVDIQLQAARTIWLSTTRPDGRPHSVPIWFIWQGDEVPEIVFFSEAGTQKARNLAAQSWVILHAGDGDDTYILEGNAEAVTDPADREVLNQRYMQKYVDPGSGAQWSFRDGDHIYRVRVQHVMAWIYGNISYRTDWHFDV